MFLAHFRTGIAFSPDGRLWVADQADQGSAGAGKSRAMPRPYRMWSKPYANCYGSQSGPRGGSSPGVDLAAIAPEHACRLIATFDPSEARTVIHVAVCEHLPR